jgi:S1-C subfamily serine protease
MAQNQTTDPTVRRMLLFGLAILIVVLVIYLLPWIETMLIRLDAEPRVVTPRGDLSGEEQTNIEIFQLASPSVVYITTLSRFINPWTRDITELPRGTGSGFIWDRHGHVVTNYHVIEGAEAAHVRLNDKRVYKATLVGASPEQDLAVLRISVPFDKPSPVPVGTSHDLKVGQKVLAIGNPFGLDYTLTTGVISALNRTIQTDDIEIEQLIQTDAAINPGNSGGPLIDSAGRLIGINTAIYSPSGAYAGIGFAVPVDTVNKVVPDIIAYGHYIRPSLGVLVDDDISEAITEQVGVKGLMILRVNRGSPAQKAGLQGARLANDDTTVIPGDIIEAIDDKPITDSASLNKVLEAYTIGDQVQVKIYRQGKSRLVPVILESSRS